MRIVKQNKRVALAQFERTAEDFRVFATVYSTWRGNLGHFPLMYDANVGRAAETFLVITRRGVDRNLFRIVYRKSPRSRGRWVGNVMIAPLSRYRITLSLFVFEDWRRRGFALDVLRLLVALLAQRGYRKVCVGVHPNNAPSLKLFRRMGFVDRGVATRSSHAWLAQDDRHLELAL